jgi:hypothetical protein
MIFAAIKLMKRRIFDQVIFIKNRTGQLTCLIPLVFAAADDMFQRFFAESTHHADWNSLDSSFKCNTQSPLGIGCCDGHTKQAPQ